ncbi:MAG: hypothetical protein JW941_12580 [Candidatus Coatesbacteria bacterium]|nr:hypothetical protein [Candidatus Coatesbacteria bacterium]
MKLTHHMDVIQRVKSADPRFNNLRDKLNLDADVILAQPGVPSMILPDGKSLASTWPKLDYGPEVWLSARGFPRSMWGAVVEALAAGWGTTVTEVLRASGYTAKETPGGFRPAKIGSYDGKEIIASVILLKRPK